ncbi:uncharacterized protein LOC126741122 [Anthonomus grandis grandis]|uniref:uncharacterized protein LOC126741122 n=1 Tax=Anthonomus grandis grandis TaxID=2921223 RepID=UPI002164FA0D|nr:uncharacterized protein LOC126741122 [Anthonomus grandis grandis]
MNRLDVENYFDLLQTTLEENDIFNKPGYIFNTDETGLQMNNRTGIVLAEKGSKSVSMATCTEKGETIFCIACCNAEGIFLSPACIMKGKYKKVEHEDGMPPGSILYMSEKSAYVNTSIFSMWLKDHFINEKELLEVAQDNDVMLLCLPSHTAHYLQPLHRAVFKSLKSYFYNAFHQWVRANPGRKLIRLQFGQMLSESWGRACTVLNEVSGFKSYGIYLFNPSAIPDHAFSVSDLIEENSQKSTCNNIRPLACKPQPPTSAQADIKIAKKGQLITELSTTSQQTREETSPIPSTSKIDVTPGTLLEQISPVPTLPEKVKRASKNLEAVLTTTENINAVRERCMKRRKNAQPKEISQKKQLSRKIPQKSNRLDGEEDNFDENECVGCLENYFATKRKDDWIQCVSCSRWLHDQCISFSNMCMKCGNMFNK